MWLVKVWGYGVDMGAYGACGVLRDKGRKCVCMRGGEDSKYAV